MVKRYLKMEGTMFDVSDERVIKPAEIKVIGIGGGGGNAVNRMFKEGVNSIELFVMNTDLQVLSKSPIPDDHKIQIGAQLTKGQGAGKDPVKGKAAAEENADEIRNLLQDTDMVFLTAGMGGGTGTGAMPVVAKIARELNILTVCVVTKPFEYEGKRRMEIAEGGILELKSVADSLIVVSNEKSLEMFPDDSISDGFKHIDMILVDTVRSLTEVITKPGRMNVDFADVKSILSDKGDAIVGIGSGEGEQKAINAVSNALNNPLLEGVTFNGAESILFVITTGKNGLSMREWGDIGNFIKQRADENANLIHGLVEKDDMEGKVEVVVVGTGLRKIEDQIENFYAMEDRIKRGDLEKPTYKRVKGMERSVDVNKPQDISIPAFLRRQAD
ncbi:cell division protein FtsZ [candidate division TA06 bacterium]|uniref:Cell division protein FtsZ n=1 Tax=candidate division TA06 bacterium TaxID=2250710 RepID=A0A660SAK9_UNCT6|nr:MAG: cell division protein FtsZ [candidate division TA06 bacterium]